MGRSGYIDDLEALELGRWRGRVASAIRGKRGQAFLRDLLAALDAMPKKRLVEEDLQRPDGEVCTLGAVGAARGHSMQNIDPTEHEFIGQMLDIAPCLVAEVEFLNDDWLHVPESPEDRWLRMRAWVTGQILEPV